MSAISSITQKGQVTIPVDMRNTLMLHQGDQVQFEIKKDKIIIRKYNQPIEKLFGIYTAKHPVSDEDIKKAIIAGATRGYHT